jgi:hypothetical protein
MLAAFAFPLVVATAQSDQSVDTSHASLTLPNAPGFGVGVGGNSSNSSANGVSAEARGLSASAAVSGSLEGASGASRPEASRTQKTIEPGQVAPTLTASDKALLGIKNAFSPVSAAGWILSAGYEHLFNSSPNYGTDRGAFGQRLGAAAIRGSSEDIFSQSVMANFFREDPRYYRMGSGHNFFVRVAYAATRPLITRTDGGRTSPNLALMAGNFGGAALTNLYYPQVNRSMEQTVETFGGSLGGTALGDAVSEFSGDVMHLFHLGHN